MSNIQTISSMLETHLSTANLKRFLATDGLILDSYVGEFLLAIYEDSWELSLLGTDATFYSKEEVYTYFDRTFSKLFEPMAEFYVYGNAGLLIEMCRNSALVILTQTQQEYLSLF